MSGQAHLILLKIYLFKNPGYEKPDILPPQNSDIWLVVWNIYYFCIYWECHHPKWRTHVFQRGRLNHQPDMIRILGILGTPKFVDATMGEIGHPMLSLPPTRLKSQHPSAKMCVLRVLFPICNPWCWYIKTYMTGWFMLGKCWCAYSSTMVRIWVSVSEFIIEIW